MAGKAAAREPVTVGTFCSGTDAPIFALRQAGIPHRHVFSAETNKHARTFIQANCPPETLYGDIMTLDLATVPRVDLFVAGPPCQPFSGMNQKRRSAGRMDDRVGVLLACLKYTLEKQPRVAVMENVPSLARFWAITENEATNGEFESTWASTVAPTIARLASMYTIHKKVLSPLDYNCPQSRPRLYVVMTRSHEVLFPERVPRTLSASDIVNAYDIQEDLTAHSYAIKICQKARLKYGPNWDGGINSTNAIGLILLQRPVYPPLRDYAHCILAEKPSLICNSLRFLSRNEVAAFQGFDPFTLIQCYETLTHRQHAKLFGNAMNVAVLKNLFVSVL